MHAGQMPGGAGLAVEAGGGDCRKGFKGREGTERGLRKKGARGFDERSGVRVTWR